MLYIIKYYFVTIYSNKIISNMFFGNILYIHIRLFRATPILNAEYKIYKNNNIKTLYVSYIRSGEMWIFYDTFLLNK